MDIVERLRAMTSSEGQRAITLARVAQLSLVHGWDNVPDAADPRASDELKRAIWGA